MSFVRTFARWSCCTATIACLVAPSFAADTKKKEVVAETTPSYYGPQPAQENIDLTMYTRIREEGFKHSHVMQFAGALTDGIGPRLTGSPNMAKANAWTRDTLTKIGLENAHLEDWGEFGMGWQQINTWIRMVTPDTAPLMAQAAPWSPATNGPVSGEAVYVDIQDVKDLDQYKGKLGGKIVLFGAMRPTPDLTEPLFHRYTAEELAEMENYPTPRAGSPDIQKLMADRARLTALRTAALKMMTEEHVAAIITPSRDGKDGGGTGIIFDDNGANLVRGAQVKETAVTIPNAVMMIEHYNRLGRLLQNHVPVTLEVNIETKFTGDHEHGFDTVAEIPGTDPVLKNQVVMVGGHLDSWISGTGATDNGAGSDRCDGGGSHPEGSWREAEAYDPHRAVVRRGAGTVRLAGLCEAALRNVCRSEECRSEYAFVHASARTFDDDQGVGDAGRLLQPRQRHRQGSRCIHAGELGDRADLPAVDCSAEGPWRVDDQLPQYGRNRSPFVRRGRVAGLPVHPGSDGLRDADAPLEHGHLRPAAPARSGAGGGGRGDLPVQHQRA